MFDFELDFESDGDCTRDDWRVEVGVLLSVPPVVVFPGRFVIVS